MRELGIAIAMEVIFQRYMPNVQSRIDAWLSATKSAGEIDRMLGQVSYKMFGTTQIP